jgi:hypothetical protein
MIVIAYSPDVRDSLSLLRRVVSRSIAKETNDVQSLIRGGEIRGYFLANS